MVATKFWTLNEFIAAFGHDAPYEVVDGELREVSPSTSDPGRVSALLSGPLVAFNEEHRLGEVFVSDAGFLLQSEPLVLVAPDVAFVRYDNIPEDYDYASFFPGSPDLAVEVRSPTDRTGAVEAKVEDYLRAGSDLVWQVDPKLRLVHVRRQNGSRQTLYLRDTLEGEGVLPGFRLPLARVFRDPAPGIRRVR